MPQEGGRRNYHAHTTSGNFESGDRKLEGKGNFKGHSAAGTRKLKVFVAQGMYQDVPIRKMVGCIKQNTFSYVQVGSRETKQVHAEDAGHLVSNIKIFRRDNPEKFEKLQEILDGQDGYAARQLGVEIGCTVSLKYVFIRQPDGSFDSLPLSEHITQEVEDLTNSQDIQNALDKILEKQNGRHYTRIRAQGTTSTPDLIFKKIKKQEEKLDKAREQERLAKVVQEDENRWESSSAASSRSDKAKDLGIDQDEITALFY